MPAHEVGALHLTYIGGFGLLILTIGAQVVSSHGLVHRFWQLHKVGGILVASLMLASALVRMSASFFPTRYFFLIGTAAIVFDLAFVVWGLGVLKHVVKQPNIKVKAST